MSDVLISLSDVTQLVVSDVHKQKILDKINLELKDREILAILGRSGSGKSTILRIIAGLINPTKGIVKRQKNLNTSMVFQTFGLLPWLNVLENVELGLEALGIAKEHRKAKALEAIDMIGLDGFETAYPKELSGGMRQRVGIARAIVVDSDVMLMDEPFSALDILTANTLKNDLLNLWFSEKMSLNAIVIVTHSIEEAVFMADRVIVLGSNPGKILSEIKIDLPRPRDKNSKEFIAISDSIYQDIVEAEQKIQINIHDDTFSNKLAIRLPKVSTNELIGMILELSSSKYKGEATMHDLTRNLHIQVSELLNIIKLLYLLEFVSLTEHSVKLNKAGKTFAMHGLDDRKKLFGQHLVNNIPMAEYIVHTLQERSDHKAHISRFQSQLEDFMPSEDATTTMQSLISLARYSEIFSYHDSQAILALRNNTTDLSEVS